MTNTTLILFKCYNPHWGQQPMFVQAVQHEKALEKYNEFILSTPKGKENPKYTVDSHVDETPIVLLGVILDEDHILKLI